MVVAVESKFCIILPVNVLSLISDLSLSKFTTVRDKPINR